MVRRSGVLTVGSLFSGIEGFGLGFTRAGAQVRWHVEIDKDCRRVIRGRFRSPERDEQGEPDEERAVGDSVLHSDVRGVGVHNLSPVELVCGGFPCQDLSVAGRRAGLAGERSGLWHEFHRVLSELRPRWVVIENVPGLLSSNEGRDMATVLRGLGELGYGWAYRVLDAQYFGVAQRRRRVFIVGCLGDTSAAVEVLFESESCDGDSPPRRQAREDLAGTLGGGSGERGWPQDTEHMTFLPEVTGTLSQGAHPGSYNGQDAYDDKFIAHALTSGGSDASEDGTGRGTPLVVDTLTSNGDAHSGQRGTTGLVVMTLPSTHRGVGNGWNTTMVQGGSQQDQFVTPDGVVPTLAHSSNSHDGHREPKVWEGASVRRLTPTECERLQGFPDGWTAGLSDSARYRMLGNAVCVPVAEWIGLRITKVAQDG